MKQLKNKKLILLVTVFLLFLMNVAYASGGVEDYQILIDGNLIQFNSDLGYPTVVNGRTLVPIRIISEDMGYKVEWENKEQKVTISDTKTKIKFKIGETTALVNGKSVPIDIKEENGKIVPVDTKAILIGNRTYVPIRFISENMGATVDWKIEGKTLYIYITKDSTEPVNPTEPIEQGIDIKDAILNPTEKTPYIGNDPKVFYKEGFPFSLAEGEPLIEKWEWHDADHTSINLTLEKKGRVPKLIFIKDKKIFAGAPSFGNVDVNGKRVYLYSTESITNYYNECDSIGFYLVDMNRLFIIPKQEFPLNPIDTNL